MTPHGERQNPPWSVAFALLALKLLVGRDLDRPRAARRLVGTAFAALGLPARRERAGASQGRRRRFFPERLESQRQAGAPGRAHLSSARDRAAHVIHGRPESGLYIQIGGVEQ